MKFEEISLKAYFNKKIDEYCDLPEKLAYLRLKDLYFEYNTGKVGENKGKEDKEKIKKEFENDKVDYERMLKIIQEYSENKRIVTNKLIELEKETDIHKKLEKSLEIIGILVRDDWLKDRNLDKLTKEL